MLSDADLAEARRLLGREPTPVEVACLENLWSEHCSYRSTKHLLRTLPTTGPDVLVGPGDDAAIVRFSEGVALAIGMESHNHPSYVDPYDGAATGVGGIVRDVLSMGARPVALMDPLYFGPLEDEKNRRLFTGVVEGIGGYGNCIGVPVVRGEVVVDPSYSGNPLVNVVCVGTVRPDAYVTGRVRRPGSKLLLVGAPTGRDGLGGASFASRDLSEDSEAADRPSVQIGDPFTEKLLIEGILAMVETGKVLSCRDLGAAGLAGASSEMCSTFGGRIQAEQVHLRETGMTPVEIMLAESQERMCLEVAPDDVGLIGGIAERFDLAWSEIGEVIAEPRYIVTFWNDVVCDLPMDVLIRGAPGCSLPEQPYAAERPFVRPERPLRELALMVLSHPEVASRAWVYEQYDHDVQVRTVDVGHDAAVLRLGNAALVLSCGCNPRQIHLKPYEGTANAVLENAANLACAGAVPVGIVNCLNFASPVHPEVYWQLVQAVRGLGDMARTLGCPVVGGNVSLYNESDEHGTQIKPTPSIGMIGRGPIRRWSKPEPGWTLALAGETTPGFGGSVLDAVTGCGGHAPTIGDPATLVQVREAIASSERVTATDLSQGGLLAALATLAPDAEVELEGDLLEALFSETPGRFLMAAADPALIASVPHRVIGRVGGAGLRVTAPNASLTLQPEEIEAALGTLSRRMADA
ncbi:MAG: phosphoribosylformylglycinamidine synthase subunit PurL [Methanospirillum sp.]|nr:phosphoribosylformylglycinamidine synthase subunit PurL [Methanospirillum sp.]